MINKFTLFALITVLAMPVAHAQDIDCASAAPVAAYLHHRATSTPVHWHGPNLLRKPIAQVGCTRESLHGVVPITLATPDPIAPVIVPTVAPVAPIADVTPASAIAAASPFPAEVAGGAVLLGAVLCIAYRCGGSSDTAGKTTTGSTGTTGTH